MQHMQPPRRKLPCSILSLSFLHWDSLLCWSYDGQVFRYDLRSMVLQVEWTDIYMIYMFIEGTILLRRPSHSVCSKDFSSLPHSPTSLIR